VDEEKIDFFHKNKDSFLEEHDIGRRYPDYRKTVDFPGRYINDHHSYYYHCPLKGGILDIGIEGWLLRADALKVYEMGYFSKGDILEIGSYRGLSTSILSQANHDSGLVRDIHTLDIDKSSLDMARENLQARGLGNNVHFHLSNSSDYLNGLIAQNTKFGFIFIDHSHEYEPVLEVCRQLSDLVIPGGFCLFHDYNDPRSFDYTTKDYKVYQAVNDGLDNDKFEFYGIFGCTILFRLCR
jgi:SAM-dependent methyltransferase